MEEKGVRQIKKLIADFRLLATKVHKNNQIKSRNLKETNRVFEACKREYQKLYHENETLKQSLPNNKRNCLNVKTRLKIKLYLT